MFECEKYEYEHLSTMNMGGRRKEAGRRKEGCGYSTVITRIPHLGHLGIPINEAGGDGGRGVTRLWIAPCLAYGEYVPVEITKQRIM